MALPQCGNVVIKGILDIEAWGECCQKWRPRRALFLAAQNYLNLTGHLRGWGRTWVSWSRQHLELMTNTSASGFWVNLRRYPLGRFCFVRLDP